MEILRKASKRSLLSLFALFAMFMIIVPTASAAVTQHVIYGPANFYKLDTIGTYTQSSFSSDGNDVQINAYAINDNNPNVKGYYYITLYKWDSSVGTFGGYVSKGRVAYTYERDKTTYSYVWSGVGKGVFKAEITAAPDGFGTISGSLTVYSQN
jgi:hypothetical protein